MFRVFVCAIGANCYRFPFGVPSEFRGISLNPLGVTVPARYYLLDVKFPFLEFSEYFKFIHVHGVTHVLYLFVSLSALHILIFSPVGALLLL